MKTFLLSTAAIALLLVAVLGLAVAFGGPAEPAPMASINRPFKNVDFSDLPSASEFVARDGSKLAFRFYPATGAGSKGSVVLVHGSSASGRSMHLLAKAMAVAGHATYALDIRGHGDSATKGDIAYIGQLEDDLEDFIQSTKPAQPATLVGFSSGGGFALRFAGSTRQRLFANYLLLSPFISQNAPTYRPNSGGWVRVGLPRYVAIALMNGVGVPAFNRLPVTRFALDETARALLTPSYSFALAQNFRPERDYRANIRAVVQPISVLAGQDDEVFYADRFDAVFKAEGKHVPVTLIPGIGHIPLTLDAAAVQAAAAAVRRMNEPRS